MASNYTVNCFILGSVDGAMFSIDIAPTETVASLRYLMKEKKKLAFDGVEDDDIQLFKAPVNDLMGTVGCWRSDTLEGFLVCRSARARS
jgi:hypothetical protein